VLTEPQPRSRRTRQQQSLRQEYGEFLLERIEEFKDQLSREELLALADEAVRELEVGPEGQLVLTEVLVLEHVDRLIMRRLNLPTFRRWRDKHLHLRRAQREPTHWGLDRHSPLVGLASSFNESDVALVVGSGAAPAGFFLAAHEWHVVFIDRHIVSVESTETQAAAEVLARRFHALVVSVGDWFPDVEPALAVLDPATLKALHREARQRFLDTLKDRTIRGGVHFMLPDLTATETGTGTRRLDVLRGHYGDWRVEHSRTRSGSDWLLATKP
jgi:hypothetical protein